MSHLALLQMQTVFSVLLWRRREAAVQNPALMLRPGDKSEMHYAVLEIWGETTSDLHLVLKISQEGQHSMVLSKLI